MYKLIRYLGLAMIMLGLVIITANAHAEPVRYYSTPVFYGKYTPKIAHCTVDVPARYGFCGWPLYAEEGEVGVTGTNGPEGVFTRLYDEVICLGDICETNYSEPRGSIESEGVTYWYVPKGFYLATIAGKVTAVKYGNGPLARNYPIRDVIIPKGSTDWPDGQFIPVEDDKTYRVWCNEARECSYMSRVMEYSKLKQYIPPVLTIKCDSLFCYDDRDRIVGTNPKTPY
uniref:Uncharacterized protein n=1 Tax=Pseudomonas phage RVTF4 TaxID=3236931 RepID=A0AB39CDB2_9VIRU